MPRTAFLTGLLAAASAVSLGAAPTLGAQSLRSLDASSTAAPVAVARPVPRVIARYTFDSPSGSAALPYLVLVADSAGTIIARASVRDQDQEIPLTVTVLDADLMLQGLTDNGLLTLVLDRQSLGDGSRIANGRWTLGRDGGTLRTK